MNRAASPSQSRSAENSVAWNATLFSCSGDELKTHGTRDISRGVTGREERAERTLWYVSTHRSERWRIAGCIAFQATLFQDALRKRDGAELGVFGACSSTACGALVGSFGSSGWLRNGAASCVR